MTMTNYNLWLLLSLIIPSISASSSAPWQSAMTSNLLEEKTYKDMPPIVFSGSGRLYSVEAVVAASVSKEDVSANLCVSIVCTDGIVILSTMTKSPHLELNVQDDDDDGIPLLLDEEEELLSIPCSQIAPGLFCATGGNAVESQLLRDKIHQIATSLYERADAGQLVTPSRVSAAMVARQLADHLQRPTQTLSAGSMLASAAVIIQPDHLWRVDPTGQFWNCKAACIGRGAGLAETYLIDHINRELKVEEAINICRDCIVHTLPKEKYHWRGMVLKKTGSMDILSNKKLSEVQS